MRNITSSIETIRIFFSLFLLIKFVPSHSRVQAYQMCVSFLAWMPRAAFSTVKPLTSLRNDTLPFPFTFQVIFTLPERDWRGRGWEGEKSVCVGGCMDACMDVCFIYVLWLSLIQSFIKKKKINHIPFTI